MGIPSYFSYIVKNYPNIIKRYNKSVLNVDNLYLDCNSIIYDIYAKMKTDDLTDSISNSIIKGVIAKIEYYIETIDPKQQVIVAFDGVAPVAKLEQQRNRRYKSWYQNEITRDIFNKDKPDPWNTTAITPGTKFMSELNAKVAAHFSKTVTDKSAPTSMKGPNITVSGSNCVGEGEHKLFDYIRKNPVKHADQVSVIYGLDADLIMLSINHLPVSPKTYLFRETPHFIGSIDSELEPDADYFLDIPELTEAIVSYMNSDKELTAEQQKSVSQRNKIYDYIFLGFFLGNDFMPHFPAVNIRTGGVDKMMNAYRATIGPNENLCDGKTIYWNNVRKMIQFLVNLEEQYIIVEHKSRNSKERHLMPQTTPEEKFRRFEATPVFERDMEKYINPVKPFWQSRYYRGLFGIKSDTNDMQKKDIAVNYLQGLEWTMKYYTSGCADWRWRYKYNYPPLLQDLIKHVPVFNTEFVVNKPANPVSEIVQLCYVLPRTQLSLLPPKLVSELLRHKDHWYKGNCDFVWAYCKYFWESHVEMNEIDINELEQFLADNKHLLLEK
jgi:5'-3' exoribonuclease 1